MVAFSPENGERHRTTLGALRTYVRESRAGYAVEGPPSIADLVRYLPRWLRDRRSSDSTMQAEVPWLPYSVIDWLDAHLSRSMRVFEFGSGGSTLFFASRVGEVTSVEHDAAWAGHVAEVVETRGLGNCSVRHIPPDVLDAAAFEDTSDPETYVSSDEHYSGKGFRTYATSIDPAPDRSLDLVVVDGRARPSCFKHAMPKVSPSGVLLLDNSDRRHYGPVQEAASDLGWRPLVLAGPTAHNPEFTQSTLWFPPY